MRRGTRVCNRRPVGNLNLLKNLKLRESSKLVYKFLTISYQRTYASMLQRIVVCIVDSFQKFHIECPLDSCRCWWNDFRFSTQVTVFVVAVKLKKNFEKSMYVKFDVLTFAIHRDASLQPCDLKNEDERIRKTFKQPNVPSTLPRTGASDQVCSALKPYCSKRKMRKR